MSIFKNSYIYVCMSEVHHNVNTGYLWVGQLFSNSQKRQLLLVYFFLCSVLFISLWFLNTKGIYVKGYIYIVFFYVDHLLKVLTECVTILLLLFMFWFFGCEACGILALWPRIELATPALKGEILTTGPLGKSLWIHSLLKGVGLLSGHSGERFTCTDQFSRKCGCTTWPSSFCSYKSRCRCPFLWYWLKKMAEIHKSWQ